MTLKKSLCLLLSVILLLGQVIPATASPVPPTPTLKTKIIKDIPIFRPRSSTYTVEAGGTATVTIQMSEPLHADAHVQFMSSEATTARMTAGTTTQSFDVPSGVTELSVTFGSFMRKGKYTGGGTYRQQYNLRAGVKRLVQLHEWYNYDTMASTAGLLNAIPMTVCTNEVGDKRIQLFSAIGLEWRQSMGGDLDQMPDWETTYSGQGCIDTADLTPGFYKVIIKNITSGQSRSKLVKLTKGTKVSVSALPDYNLSGAQTSGIVQYVNSITSLTIKPHDIEGLPQDPFTCSLYNVNSSGISPENEQRIKSNLIDSLLSQSVTATRLGNQCVVKKQGVNINMQVQRSIISSSSENNVLMFDSKSNQTADVTFNLSETLSVSGTGTAQTFNKNTIDRFTAIIQNRITGDTTTTTTGTIKLPAGDYVATFMADGYLNITKDLKLTGGNRAINVNMIRASQYRKIDLNAYVWTKTDDPVTVNHISMEAEVYADDATKVKFPLTGSGVFVPFAPDEEGKQRWHAVTEVPTGKSIKIIVTAECTARAVSFTYKASTRIKVQPEGAPEPSQVYNYSDGAGAWSDSQGGQPSFTIPMTLAGETVNIIVKRKDAANGNRFEDAEVTNISADMNIKNREIGYTDFKITEPNPSAIWLPHRQFFRMGVTVPGAIDINKYRSEYNHDAVMTGRIGFRQNEQSVISRSVKTPISFDPAKYSRPAIFFTYEKSRLHDGNIVANIKLQGADDGKPELWAITSGRILVTELPATPNPAVKPWKDTIQLTDKFGSTGAGEFVIGVPNKSSRYEFSGHVRVAQKQIINGKEMFAKGSGKKVDLTTESILVDPISGFGYYNKNIVLNMQTGTIVSQNEKPLGSYYPYLGRLPDDCSGITGESHPGSRSLISTVPYELGGFKTELATAKYVCPFPEGSLHIAVSVLRKAPEETKSRVNYYAFNADAFAKLKHVNETFSASWVLDRPLGYRVKRCEVGKALGEEDTDALVCWVDVTTPFDPDRPDQRREWWFPVRMTHLSTPIINSSSIYETNMTFGAGRVIHNLFYVRKDFNESGNETKLKQFKQYRNWSEDIVPKLPFKASEEHMVKITLRSEDNSLFALSQREYDLSTGKPTTYVPDEYKEMESIWKNTIVELKTNKQEKSYKWIEKSLANMYQRNWLIKGDLPIQLTITAPSGRVLAIKTIATADDLVQTFNINPKAMNEEHNHPLLILQAETDHPDGFAGKKVYATIDPSQMPTARTFTSGVTADAYAFWGGRVIELPVDGDDNKKTKQIQVKAFPLEVRENKVKVIFYTSDTESLMSKTWIAPLMSERVSAMSSAFNEMNMEMFVDTMLEKAIEHQGPANAPVFVWQQKDITITTGVHSIKGRVPYLGKNSIKTNVVTKCFDINATSDQGFHANLIDVAVVLAWVKGADLTIKSINTFRRVGQNARAVLAEAKATTAAKDYRNTDFILRKRGNDIEITNIKSGEKWRELVTFEQALEINIKTTAQLEKVLSTHKMLRLLTQQPFTFWLRYLKPLVLTLAPFGGLPPSGMPIVTIKSPEESRFIVPNCAGCAETMQITQWITNHFNKPLAATPINVCIKARDNRSMQIKAIAAGHEPHMQIMTVNNTMNNQIHIPLRRNTYWGLTSIENFFQAHPMMQEQVEAMLLAPEMYAATSERGGLLNYIASGLSDFAAAVASDFKIKPGVIAPGGGGMD